MYSNRPKTSYSLPFRYTGNLAILAISLLFPPITIFLILKNMHFFRSDDWFYLNYPGSWGWVIFWSLIFFPISILLLVLKGSKLARIHNYPLAN